MRRSNPEPVFLTTNSFALSGAGMENYAFFVGNQCVIQSCYTRYSVALRFFRLKSMRYSILLQNGISHAYMCVCGQERAYTRAPTRECPNYIATNSFKSLKNKRKSVARSCSLDAVLPCYGEKNKIFGFYSEKTDGAERPEELDGRNGQNDRPNGLSAGDAGRVVQTVAGGVRADDLQVFKKWRISAVFGKAFNAAFNVRASNVIQKAQVSAVFRAVRTFFLKMFTGAETAPGGIPPKRSHRSSICPARIFFDFRTGFLLTAGEAGRLFFSWAFGD